MRYDFSSQFFRIIPPATNFGDAWEALCDHLLREEFGDAQIVRLTPPDRGIDILHRRMRHAYQCKSSERGAFGTINASDSSQSLEVAHTHRPTFKWEMYFFATNANYTGAGMEKLLKRADELGLNQEEVAFLGPEYWDRMCVKYESTVRDRFDYRLAATTEQVIDAFRKARYFEEYIQEYTEKIRKGHFSLIITNNRIPVEIEIPFSPELSVENYLDVAKQFFGISLDWTNFNDLQTSTGPSVSVTIDQKAQPFGTKIQDLPLKSGDKLEIWLTVVWRDETQKVATEYKDTAFHLMYSRSAAYSELTRLRQRTDLSQGERRKLTVERGEEILQSMIWKSVREFEGNRK